MRNAGQMTIRNAHPHLKAKYQYSVLAVPDPVMMASEDKTLNFNNWLYSSLSNGYCTALPFIYSSTKMKKMRCSQDDISIGSYLGTFYSSVPGQFWTVRHKWRFTGQCPMMGWNLKKFSFYSLWDYFLGRLSLLLWNIWWCTFDAVSLLIVESSNQKRAPMDQ